MFVKKRAPGHRQWGVTATRPGPRKTQPRGADPQSHLTELFVSLVCFCWNPPACRPKNLTEGNEGNEESKDRCFDVLEEFCRAPLAGPASIWALQPGAGGVKISVRCGADRDSRQRLEA